MMLSTDHPIGDCACDYIDLRNPMEYSKFVDVSPKISLKHLPKKIKNLLFRHNYITKLSKNLISKPGKPIVIQGLTGIGKSEIVYNTLHFLAERKYFTYALIVLKLHQVKEVKNLIRELFLKIVDAFDVTHS